VSAAIERVKTSRALQALLAFVALYTITYWIPGSPWPDKMPWGVLTQGIIFGTSYALLAMGLILVYRTTRIVNFASGAMGAMPGAFTVGLFVAKGWNYFLAIAVGTAVGIGLGALIEITVIRRFARSSRLVLTVATIGLAQLLGAIGLVVLIRLGATGLIGDIRTPLSSSWFVRPYPVRGDHILMLGIAPIVLAGLGWFLLRTDTGRAVRAAAENQDRALLLGVPVRKLQTLVWAIAGGLATITYVTRAPFTGVVPDPGALTGATAILPGLAVAVIARFQSLPIALWAGIGLGIAEWTIRWNVHAASIFDVVFLIVILGSLLIRKGSTSRADTGESSWDAAGVLKPIPAALRKLPSVRGTVWGVAALGAAALILVPLVLTPSTVTTLTFTLVTSLIAVSLVVLTGWGGNVSLGQVGIVGIGAMAAGNVMTRWNLDLFLGLAAGMFVGGLVAVLIGLPALRIRGFYLAVTTLAFAVALDSYFLNPVNFSSFVPETTYPPILWKRFDMESQWVRYYFVLGTLVAAVALVRALRRSRGGRVIIGTRDNERAASAMAVPTTRVKLQTFVLSGVLAGLAGALYVITLAPVGTGQGTFPAGRSIELFSMTVIGGIASVAGGISGVALFSALDFALGKVFSGDIVAILRYSLSGFGLLMVLYFLPGGLWQAVQRVRDRWLRGVAKRHEVDVPVLDDDDTEHPDHAEDETEVVAGALS
jgi:branched-chain amino acid transport system permease protein